MVACLIWTKDKWDKIELFHRHQNIVASAEIGTQRNNYKAKLHIWDHGSLHTLSQLRKDQFSSYLYLISFSSKPNDDIILTVSREKQQVVLLVDWKRNELLYSIVCNSEKLLWTSFVFDTNDWLACISRQHLMFYHINWNTKPLRIKANKRAEVQNVYTGAATHGLIDKLLVGDKVGSIYIWELKDGVPKLDRVRECVTDDEIQSITHMNRDTYVLANQGKIIIWNAKLDTIEQFTMNVDYGHIQTICCFKDQNGTFAFIVGTKLNFILQKSMDRREFVIIMQGHTGSSIAACSVVSSDTFFSVSGDRYLFKWNSELKSVEWTTKCTQPISCCDVHPDRNVIILGTETSKLLLYDTLTSYYIATVTLKVNTSIKTVKFSPDGEMVAVGLQNGNVYVYDVIGNGDFNLRDDGTLK
ncbi:unnamed protein product, partial [Didymodactylos carnosus]